MWITVGCLFIGRAVTPLASESLDASTTALIEDTPLNITAADLASLSSAGAVCGALGKILAGPTIGIVNGRNAWLMLLFFRLSAALTDARMMQHRAEQYEVVVREVNALVVVPFRVPFL